MLSLVGLALGGYLGVLAGCQFDQGGVYFNGQPDASGGHAASPDAGQAASPDGGVPQSLADASTPPDPMPDAAMTSDPPDASAPVCQDPYTQCNSSCVDLSRDRDHCGSCEHKCRHDETCSDGQCHH